MAGAAWVPTSHQTECWYPCDLSPENWTVLNEKSPIIAYQVFKVVWIIAYVMRSDAPSADSALVTLTGYPEEYILPALLVTAMLALLAYWIE